MAKKQAKQKQLISKGMTIMDVVEKYPECGDIMMAHGMHCIGCMMASGESLEQGAIGHGMDEEGFAKMLADMNEVAARKKKK